VPAISFIISPDMRGVSTGEWGIAGGNGVQQIFGRFTSPGPGEETPFL